MRVYSFLPTTNNALGGVEHNSTNEPFTDERLSTRARLLLFPVSIVSTIGGIDTTVEYE